LKRLKIACLRLRARLATSRPLSEPVASQQLAAVKVRLVAAVLS
jgi:hypothetical protein